MLYEYIIATVRSNPPTLGDSRLRLRKTSHLLLLKCTALCTIIGMLGRFTNATDFVIHFQ